MANLFQVVAFLVKLLISLQINARHLLIVCNIQQHKKKLCDDELDEYFIFYNHNFQPFKHQIQLYLFFLMFPWAVILLHVTTSSCECLFDGIF